MHNSSRWGTRLCEELRRSREPPPCGLTIRVLHTLRGVNKLAESYVERLKVGKIKKYLKIMLTVCRYQYKV